MSSAEPEDTTDADRSFSPRPWLLLEPGDVVFAIAPLFHITGLSLNAGIALLNDATLSMSGRFEPSVVLDAFTEHGVTTTVGSITAFNAFFRVAGAGA